jgi:RNA polymerase sigma factor (sigma-70 family)
VSAVLEAEVATPEAHAASLYQRHHAAIFRYCVRQLRRREDADDAVQTTFIYALLSLKRGVVPELEAPWLFTIARNVCSTRRRSRTRRSELESPQDLDSLQDIISSPDRSSRASANDLRAALNTLPERQRKAMLLREWQGLSYHEIGAELGLSQQAIETLLFRARRNLAQRLDIAGVRALNGVWLLSLVRSFFRTSVVAIGTAATVAAVPSAVQHKAPPTQQVRPAPIVGAHDVGNPTPTATVQRSRPAGPKQSRSVMPSRARTVPPTTDVPVVEQAQSTPPPPDSPPPVQEQPTPATPPEPPNVVPDGSEVVPPLPAVEVPEVKLPVPEVQLPPLPEVQLPAVTVPTLPG